MFKGCHKRRDLPNFVAIGRGHNDCPATRMRQHVSVAFDCVTGIERNANDARDGTAQEKILRFDTVIFEHPHSIAGAQTQTEQPIGHLNAAVPSLPKSDSLRAMNHGNSICVVGSSLTHQARHG